MGNEHTAGIAKKLDDDSFRTGERWWQTSTAALIINLATDGRLTVVLAAMAKLLREGFGPEWLVGSLRAADAFRVAAQWINSGVEPVEVEGWMRAGCWDPPAAKLLIDHGIRPYRLLNEHGRPAVFARNVRADGADLPVALAVADHDITVAEAVQIVVRSAAAAERGRS